MALRARHEREKEHLRKMILDAAVNIIIAEGYDKLSMRKIADQIDYSPTTIYIYYKDKAQIVHDLSMQIYEKIVFNIKKGLKEREDLPIVEQIEYTFQEFLYSITSNEEVGKAVIRSGIGTVFGPMGQTEPPEEHGITLLQALLLKGQQEAVLRELDNDVSWMLITALLGFAMHAIEHQLYLEKNWPALVNSYAKILINGLLAEKGGQK